jgi:methyl-accepting chemotaxis protein
MGAQMPRLRIKDLSISVKSLLAPIAGTVITIAIVVMVVFANDAASRSASRANEAAELVATVTRARLDFVQAHAALFRTVSWRSNNIEPPLVAAALKEAMGGIVRATETLRTITAAGSPEQAGFEALTKRFGDYADAAKQTGDIVQDDPFIATMMMTDAHQKSLAAAEAFQNVIAVIARESAELRAGATETLRRGLVLIVAAAAGGIVLALVLALVSARLIARPVVALTGVLDRLAEGDLSVGLPADERADEIGAMTRAVAVLKRNSEEMLRLRAEQAETEARAAATRKAEMHRLAEEFEAAIGAIVKTVSSASTELEAAASTLTHTADTTQQLSGTVAAASEQASANVQSVASATEEMTSSVGEIGRQVLESSRIATDAVSQAQRTDGRIAELSQAAARIGDVVKLITAIAEQTNLLALNATIEAARAGDAGRGFAVVAQEVKALAAQTAKATEEIGVQIAGMQAATSESVSAIKEIGATISRISGITSTIAAAVEEQGAATQEIARNVHQAAQGTAQVAGSIADVNRGATETGSASSQVLASARSLAGESSRLRLEVERFMTTVRAA